MTEAKITTAPTSSLATTPQPNSQPNANPTPAEGVKNSPAKKEPELDNLYEALQRVGVYNITTLAKRLGIAGEEEMQEDEADSAKNKEPEIAAPKKTDAAAPKKIDIEATKKTADNQVRNNAKKLLRLMGLDDNDDCVSMLEDICIQGKGMLGELSSTTITSAPTSQFARKKHKSENAEVERPE